MNTPVLSNYQCVDLSPEQGKPMVCSLKDHMVRETSKEIGSLFWD